MLLSKLSRQVGHLLPTTIWKTTVERVEIERNLSAQILIWFLTTFLNVVHGCSCWQRVVHNFRALRDEYRYKNSFHGINYFL